MSHGWIKHDVCMGCGLFWVSTVPWGLARADCHGGNTWTCDREPPGRPACSVLQETSDVNMNRTNRWIIKQIRLTNPHLTLLTEVSYKHQISPHLCLGVCWCSCSAPCPSGSCAPGTGCVFWSRGRCTLWPGRSRWCEWCAAVCCPAGPRESFLASRPCRSDCVCERTPSSLSCGGREYYTRQMLVKKRGGALKHLLYKTWRYAHV